MAAFQLKFNTYVFPHVQTFRDTFNNLTPRTVRMVGAAGGFDQYGTVPAPAEIGQVAITFELVASSRGDMQAKIDEVAALSRLGLKKLYYQPEGSLNERWCYARVNNISISRRPSANTEFWQTIIITFQVPDPHWYEDSILALTATISSTITYKSTSVISGNVPPVARVRFAPTGSYVAENPRVYISGEPYDVQWTGTLLGASSDVLFIDPFDRTVEKNDVDSIANFDFEHPDWIVLTPGIINTLAFGMAGATNNSTVSVYYYPTWR